VLSARWAAETPRSSGRGLDVAGQSAAIVALTALAAAMIGGGQRGFGDPAVLAGFTLAVLAAVGFLLIEARVRRPILPLGLFASRTFSTTTAIGLVVNVAFYGLIFVFSLYFQTAEHYSPLVTGLAFAPTTLAVLVGNLLAGRMSTRFGARSVIATGSLLMAAALIGLLIITGPSPYPALVGQLTALGFGLGLLVPAMTSALLGSVERSRSGVASGTLNTARQSGSVIGVALFGSLTAGGLIAGLRLALLVSIALALLVAALTSGIGRRSAGS
jgi:MFS transporter, DHA2 family, methylenomycin A resistance protein